jgi:hypothetical protein
MAHGIFSRPPFPYGGVLAPLDEKKLRACLQWAEEHDDEEDRIGFARAFQEMLDRNRALSDKQRAWIYGIHERLFGEPEYQNDWSEGRVPRGREVPTPAVLRNLPKKPPPRRADD